MKELFLRNTEYVQLLSFFFLPWYTQYIFCCPHLEHKEVHWGVVSGALFHRIVIDVTKNSHEHGN